ncbi:MAG: lipopolysaccharide kinase InaA family protein [Planctomycetota bacterium]|nr:lipopolysaccharide kinase InaA family protein [Planctomycetota bacterium]
MSEAGSTREIRDRYDVPDGIHLHVEPHEIRAWLPACEEAVRRVARDPQGLTVAGVGGRGPLARIEHADGALLVRRYRKGGLLRHVRGRRFRGRWRPLDELVLHHRLAGADVPVPEAVGCVVLPRGQRWHGFLLVREVPAARDLEAWLHGVRAGIAAAPADVLRRAGRAVRRLHDAGVVHADLHPKNLLVTRDGGVLVIDLDRARRTNGSVPDEARLGNLVRLGRSIEKHRLKGLRTGRREALRFLEGYAGSRSAAAELLERVRARLGRGLALRMLWWRLRGEARPWRGDGGTLAPEGARR